MIIGLGALGIGWYNEPPSLRAQMATGGHFSTDFSRATEDYLLSGLLSPNRWLGSVPHAQYIKQAQERRRLTRGHAPGPF
jgi:hypothetical protein